MSKAYGFYLKKENWCYFVLQGEMNMGRWTGVFSTSERNKDIKLWNEHNKHGAYFKLHFINLSEIKPGSPTEEAEDHTV